MELDGNPVDLDQIKALALVNYGHFTSMRVEGRAGVRGLNLHLERLSRDCRAVFSTELDAERVRELVRHALDGTDETVVVRVTVFDPQLDLGHIGAAAQPHILVTMRGAPHTPLGPLRLQSAVYTRDLPKVKHIGLFGALHQRRGAQRNGYDDVVFTTADGTLTEIATSNIGLIDTDGRLIWPRADVLPGITMKLLSQTRDEEVLTEPITLAQLPQFTAAVATNAAVGVRAVSCIDDTEWPADHDTISILRKEYEAIPPDRI
ncbi:aminotransferase class IV family protein [Streptomyces sp. NPDC059083]|uniref:aminotransferase class IV family protein n=1 Tax=Streptomyces sp. NPDC059083 TaxID=3346721 RepID=UPI0036B62C5E